LQQSRSFIASRFRSKLDSLFGHSRGFCLMALLVFSCPAPAASAGPAKSPMASSASKPRTFSAGLVVGYMDYKEPGLMREYGPLYGVGGSYTRFTDATFQWRFEGELVTGRLLYDGGNFSGARYTKPTTDWIIDVRALAVLNNAPPPAWSVSLYAGLGFRDLNDKIEGSGSYNRNISYLYLPLGMRVEGGLAPKWSLSFSGELDIMPYGTVISSLSEVDPNAPDIVNHNSGLGGRLTATLHKDMGRFDGHISFIYKKWKVDQSDEVPITINGSPGTLSEPENEFDFFGATVGADF
jgi:hypothetical protein